MDQQSPHDTFAPEVSPPCLGRPRSLSSAFTASQVMRIVSGDPDIIIKRPDPDQQAITALITAGLPPSPPSIAELNRRRASFCQRVPPVIDGADRPERRLG